MSAETPLPQESGYSVWYELPVTDLDASKAFYEQVLGITMIKDENPDLPNPMVWFNDPKAPGSFGHLYPGKPAPRGTGNTVHMLAADPLEDVMPRIEKAGGKIVSPIIPLPSGRFVYIEDIDGNSVGFFNWT